MNSFIESMNNMTYTENGAVTFKSSTSQLVDFFFHGGALRSEQDTSRILNLFYGAFKEQPTVALRILFYLRDIRGGQGERRIFRTIIQSLGFQESEWLAQNLHLIPEYGRWDDLFILLGQNCPMNIPVLSYIHQQLTMDNESYLRGGNISLLAKWLPSENASSVEHKHLARIIAAHCNITPRQYRKLLSKLRAKIDIVERKLSTRQFNLIDYATVPSKAGLLYKGAFKRNDEARYTAYLNAVENGEAKINTSTLYPYELLEKIWKEGDNQTVNTMWKNLPDYVPGFNGLVVADTSGSMNGRPMAVSVSLAMYIAERNKNEAWKDCFISFSERPKFHKIQGNTLTQKARSVMLGDVANTNLQAVFDLVLDRAKANNVPQEDMPQALIIVSDMEFDSCTVNNRATNFENIKKRYEDAGYSMPTLIFWNVDSRQTQSPIKFTDTGVVLLSGCSPVVFKYALATCTSPLDMVYNVTNSERYAQIVYDVE